MTIYNFENYKEYLKTILKTTGTTRGRRIQLAKALGTQPGFISQVLNGGSHFSLEHIATINEFLDHDKDESHFLMLLAQYGRAGSYKLKKYFKDEIEKILKEKSKIKSAIDIHSDLNEKDFARYYSNWYYAAIHILVSISQYNTKENISKKLCLPIDVVSESLKFLLERGLVVGENRFYKISEKRIHLDKSSPLINKHHTNWRVEAIKSLEKENSSNLHYSSIFSFSKKDQKIIYNLFLEFIKKVETVIKDSKEEELYSINLDFFSY